MWNLFPDRRPGAAVAVGCAALLLTSGAGWFKFHDAQQREALMAGPETVRAATESTIAMLSYSSDTVEEDLLPVRDQLTGDFRDSFTTLINDVVIPSAREKKTFSTATVPAAASVSADSTHALVLLYVNQTTVIADDPPTDTASSVKVALERIDGRWLVSDFTPI
jgi:Mce-associated membrane protein